MAENGNERPVPLKVKEDKVGMMPWMIALILSFHLFCCSSVEYFTITQMYGLDYSRE
jgi:hypothetical protein